MRYPKVKIIIRKDGSHLWFVNTISNPSAEESKALKEFEESFSAVAKDSDDIIYMPEESTVEVFKP